MDIRLSISMDRQLVRQLTTMARKANRSRSELVRDLLRRHLVLQQHAELRRRTMPFAEARGYLTDEDVFREVS